MKLSKGFAALFLGAVVTFSVTAAFAESKLNSTVQAFAVTTNDAGKEQLQPAKEVDPGQVVEMHASYKNNGDNTIRNLVVTAPVPANMHYVADSQQAPVTAEFTVSIDRGTTFKPEPITRKVKNDKGEMVEIVVPATEYTHLRWKPQPELAANTQQVYTYRVKVD